MQLVILCELLKEEYVQIRMSSYSEKLQCAYSDVFKYVYTQSTVHVGSLDRIVKQHIMSILYSTHE